LPIYETVDLRSLIILVGDINTVRQRAHDQNWHNVGRQSAGDRGVTACSNAYDRIYTHVRTCPMLATAASIESAAKNDHLAILAYTGAVKRRCCREDESGLYIQKAQHAHFLVGVLDRSVPIVSPADGRRKSQENLIVSMAR
jgi:hypothetical protein